MSQISATVSDPTSTVLIVDDEETNRSMLARQLRAEGYQVLEADGGEQALTLMAAQRIDAVLVDVLMPGIDGIELTRRIKQHQAWLEIPIIILTGSGDTRLCMAALDAGAEEFLTRPVEQLELRARLRNLLRLRKSTLRVKEQNAQLAELLADQSARVLRYERFSRIALDALSEHIAIVDAEGAIVAVNATWRRFYQAHGWRHDEAGVGELYLEQPLVVGVPQEAQLREGVARVMRDDARELVIESCLGEREHERWYAVRIARFDDSAPPYCVISHEDITSRRADEQALRDVAVKLEESQQQMIQAQKMESVGRLAGGVAHDFNNILTSIICFTRFVADDLAPSDPRRADLMEVLKAADSAAKLTSQLLAFSRRRPAQAVMIDLNLALTNVDRVLRRTLGEQIEVVILPADEPMCTTIDASHLDQLVFNLAVNARDAMPAGGTLTLRLARHELLADHDSLPAGQYVELKISDTGQGISQETLPRIFDPFFTTKGDKGTGLGLAACYGIVEQAAGRIYAHSVIGEGTTFTVLFPRAAEVATEEKPPSLRYDELGLHGTVLIVEDQPAILRTMTRAFESAGLNTVSAQTAEDALELLRVQTLVVDLVVTDIVLPRMSGIHMVEALRRERPQLRVLFVSGYAGDDPTQTVPTDDRTAFCAKPFTGRQLILRAASLFGANGEEP